jgi:hypothetical protein
MLRHRRLVDEQPAGAQDACDLPQRHPRTGGPAAHVIAGSEVDDEIEAGVLEREVTNVTLEHGHVQPAGAHSLLRDRDQQRVDVDPDELHGT